MAKKQAFVVIEIDPDAKPQASVTQHDEGVDGVTGKPTTLFRIRVYPNDINGDNAVATPESLKTSLAHELGHVVAYMVKTEANKNDPRSKPMGNRWTENPGQAVIDSEREAWEIARMIVPDLDEQEAKRNLDSYVDHKPELDSQMKAAILLDGLLGSMGRLDKQVN